MALDLFHKVICPFLIRTNDDGMSSFGNPYKPGESSTGYLLRYPSNNPYKYYATLNTPVSDSNNSSIP